MVRRALRLCRCTGCAHHPGPCPEMVELGRCTVCAPAYEKSRGTRQARGYDAEHDRLREWWRPKVERGGVHCHAVVCLMPARLILVGQAWHLDHNDDRTGYRGPAHSRCNLSAGGKAARH